MITTQQQKFWTFINFWLEAELSEQGKHLNHNKIW